MKVHSEVAHQVGQGHYAGLPAGESLLLTGRDKVMGRSAQCKHTGRHVCTTGLLQESNSDLPATKRLFPYHPNKTLLNPSFFSLIFTLGYIQEWPRESMFSHNRYQRILSLVCWGSMQNKTHQGFICAGNKVALYFNKQRSCQIFSNTYRHFHH